MKATYGTPRTRKARQRHFNFMALIVCLLLLRVLHLHPSFLHDDDDDITQNVRLDCCTHEQTIIIIPSSVSFARIINLELNSNSFIFSYFKARRLLPSVLCWLQQHNTRRPYNNKQQHHNLCIIHFLIISCPYVFAFAIRTSQQPGAMQCISDFSSVYVCSHVRNV